MYVIPVSTILAPSFGHFRSHEELVEAGTLVEYNDSMAGKVLFVSHTWRGSFRDLVAAVAHVARGSLDVMQHRRALPFRGAVAGHTPVVLDDADRLFSRTWLSIGGRTTANRLRMAGPRATSTPLALATASSRAAAIAPL